MRPLIRPTYFDKALDKAKASTVREVHKVPLSSGHCGNLQNLGPNKSYP